MCENYVARDFANLWFHVKTKKPRTSCAFLVYRIMADAVIAAQQQPMPAVKIVKPVRAPTLAPDTVLCVAEDGASIRICDVDRVLRSETTNGRPFLCFRGMIANHAIVVVVAVVVGLMPASANCTSTRYPGDTVGWGFCPSSGRIFYNGASR